MNFQDLKKVESADFYIDLAFRRAKETAFKLRQNVKGYKLEKSKKIEAEKITTIKNVLDNKLEQIIISFPDLEKLPEFYKELIKCTIDWRALKKSLGAVSWCKIKVNDIFAIYNAKIKKCQDITKINSYRREFYGRISSLLKQIKSNLLFLEESRKIMSNFPNIKTKLFTIAIAGFPNVGKTTLLSRLSRSKPEIKEYAFTTKSLNLGYMEINNKKIQLIDTPGTLNRFDKMNSIEKQAYLAINHCTNLIIYVFDLTEPYPLKDQEKLFKKLKKGDKKIIIYLSKTDILKKEKIHEFNKKHKAISNIDELKQKIREKLNRS